MTNKTTLSLEETKTVLDKLTTEYGKLKQASIRIKLLEDYLKENNHVNELGYHLENHQYLHDAVEKAYTEMFVNQL